MQKIFRNTCFFFVTTILVVTYNFALPISSSGEVLSPYMGGPVETTTLPNGAVLNSYIMENILQTQAQEPEIIKITDGVWQVLAASFVYPVVIEGKDGLIVYDTGDDIKDGKKILELIRTVSNKPINTLIYSHAHYPFGSTVLVDDPENVLVIGNPELNRNIQESGGLGASIPELSPVLTARAYEQFSVYLPEDGPDAKTPSPVGGERGFIPVNRTVENAEELVVDGVKMVFFTEYDSDSDDQTIVWLPEKKVIIQNHFWPSYPNLYTLRGSLYRDPVNWAQGLAMMRDLEPEYLLSTHTLPISGKENVREALNKFHDGMMYVYDQTLRGILQGYTPEELRSRVKLPEYLSEFPNNAETYGEISYYPPATYYYALGWFDRNASTINPVDPDLEAQKIVEGFGGPESVKKSLRESFEKKEYAWVAQLSDYLILVTPNDQEVKQIKADALRQMGYVSPSTIPRSWYLTQALALEGKVKVASIVPPTVDEVMATNPGMYINFFRVRLDPGKSANLDRVLQIEFTDYEQIPFALHLRRGVAEFVAEPKDHYKPAEMIIQMPRETWARFYVGEITIEDVLNAEETSFQGNQTEIIEFINMFDRFDS